MRRQDSSSNLRKAAWRWCSRPSACCPGGRCGRTSVRAGAVGPRRVGRGARVADRQLSLVGLSDWAERKVGELSGGMQQRVGLARAFATDAPILLMDEPFSALDPLIRTKLAGRTSGPSARPQATIIFVSHDLDEAFKIGNRIAIMEGGRIVQCGTPREIVNSPVNEICGRFRRQHEPDCDAYSTRRHGRRQARRHARPIAAFRIGHSRYAAVGCHGCTGKARWDHRRD
jgi:ABC-type proline/glycine betaine transport system ATPase subunit